jgi:hypothetical protein
MRLPYVAGQFYSSSESGLKEQIKDCFLSPIGPKRLPEKKEEKRDILGCIVPHAGYMYSGPVAAHVYYKLSTQIKPESIVIICPNHTGRGSGVALSKDDWKTPLGVAKTDKEIVESLWKSCEILDLDEEAHVYEHSLEVQLPFLQYIYGDFNFVPISLGIQDLDTAREVAACLSTIKKDILVIASSDFTHYEPKEEAEKKDKHAISYILNLDEKKFIQTVYENNLSICGFGPIATCIATVKKRGATKGELLKYATSGDVTGDFSQVVGYAGILFRS